MSDDIDITFEDELIEVVFPDTGVNLSLYSPPANPPGFVPTPVGEADGRMLYVDSNALVYGDAPAGGPGGGVTDHGSLTGLADDDHTQYHNDARGDARYSQLGHEHPEYADFTYSLGLAGDQTLNGGTYNGDGTITCPMVGFFGIPAGTVLKVLFYENPDSSYDKGYIYTVDGTTDTWVFEPYDTPFTLANVGQVISINFDLAANDALLGAVQYQTPDFLIERVAWSDHTHTGYAPVIHTHTGYAPVIHTHPVAAVEGAQVDVRESAQEYLRADWNERTAPLMVTNPTPEVTSGSYSATWEITRATSRGTLPHTPDGLDVQWFGRVRRPWTDEEVTDAGQTFSVWPYQTFYELLTLTRPSIQNDWFEWARNMRWNGGSLGNKATYFYENTIVGGVGEEPHNVTHDTGVEVGQPERARMTLDTATSTLTLWNWLPYDNGDTGNEQCPRGLWWKPVFSDTNAAWASMADPETETVPAVHVVGYNEGDPEVIEPWRIGIQGRVEVAEFFIYEFGDTTPLLQIDDDCLSTAGVGSKSFGDSTGLNTISTTDAYTVPGPAAVQQITDVLAVGLPVAASIEAGPAAATHTRLQGYDNPLSVGDRFAAVNSSSIYSGVWECVSPGVNVRVVLPAPGQIIQVRADSGSIADFGDGNFFYGGMVASSYLDGIGQLMLSNDVPWSYIAAHKNSSDPHGDRAYAAALGSNYATAAQGSTADTAIQPASPLLLPDPTALPDGKIVKVSSGGWVSGDESGGGGVVRNPNAKLDGETQRSWTIPGFARNSATVSTSRPSTNRPTFCPIRTEQEYVYDRIAVEVTVAGAAGTKVRIAFFTIDDYWQPDTLLFQTGQMAVDVGSVPTLVEETINWTLPAGNYMAMLIQSGAAQFRSVILPTPEPLQLMPTGAAAFRAMTTLTSQPTYVSGGFPSSSPQKWDRDIGSVSPTTSYLFKMREAI